MQKAVCRLNTIMKEIRFYHLQRTTIKNALPAILEKALARGMRALILLENDDEIKQMDQWLWSYKQESFLPHGCDGDDKPQLHPIWITKKHENKNNANLLILTDGLDWQGDVSGIELQCEIFHDDAMILPKLRKKWQDVKTQDFISSYWQQDDHGRWQKKA